MGYNPGERDKYWEEISGVMKQKIKMTAKFGARADNDGKLGKRKRQNIGKSTLSEKMKKGMGGT